MSSLPNLGWSTSTTRRDSVTLPPSIHTHDAASRLGSIPDWSHSLVLPATKPATRAMSHQPSEDSGTTMLNGFYDGGAFDNASRSSVTLQDEFPWHEVGVNKRTNKIPATIAPALLQLSPYMSTSRSSSDDDEGRPREVGEDSRASGDDMPRYSASQKGKWNARTDGDDTCNSSSVRYPSPQFDLQSPHNSVEDWVVHNRPVLQEYADRQTSLPLGRRLEVTIDEPPRFILGALQLLVNRDLKSCTDHSRKLGPQLIENFVDIERWAKDYFRSRHAAQLVDSDVPALLTIVMNNFYEGQVQLIDRLVEFALEHMRFCGRSSLHLEDFSFGFDFRMSQDLPFYVETSSRIRKPLPIPAVEVRSTTQPMTTHSGRQVKPTERAQAASEQASGRRNKGRNSPDKQVVKSPVPSSRQLTSFVQPSSQRSGASVISQDKVCRTTPAPPKATSEYTKHRALRSSNLKLPSVLPWPSSRTGASQSNSPRAEANVSAPADSPKVSGPSGSSLIVNARPRLKIRLPLSRLPTSTSTGSAANGPETTDSSKTNGLASLGLPANRSEATTTRRSTARPARPRGPRNGRGRGQECGSTSTNSNPEPAETMPVNTDNAIDTCHDGPSTPSRTRTRQALLLPKTDPGHPRQKKRKLDDCED